MLFNLVQKHSPVSFFTWNALVPLCHVRCARFDIFPSFFSETKVQTSQKIQGNVLLHNWKAHAKIRALLKEKTFYPKKSLTFILHQAIQFIMSQCFIHKVVQHKKFPKERIWGSHHLPFYILFSVNFLKIVLERRIRHNYANLCPKLLHVSTDILLVYNFCPWQRLVQINITSIHRSAIRAERFVSM